MHQRTDRADEGCASPCELGAGERIRTAVQPRRGSSAGRQTLLRQMTHMGNQGALRGRGTDHFKAYGGGVMGVQDCLSCLSTGRQRCKSCASLPLTRSLHGHAVAG